MGSVQDDVATIRAYIEEIELRGYGQAKRARLTAALNRIVDRLTDAPPKITTGHPCTCGTTNPHSHASGCGYRMEP